MQALLWWSVTKMQTVARLHVVWKVGASKMNARKERLAHVTRPVVRVSNFVRVGSGVHVIISQPPRSVEQKRTKIAIS